MNYIYIVFLVLPFQIGVNAHDINSLRYGNVRNDDTTKLYIFDNDINISTSFESTRSSRKIKETKDDLKCARKNNCKKCIKTVLSNDKHCSWFVDTENSVCAAAVESGIGERHDVCKTKTSKSKQNKMICAAKTSTGCAACLDTVMLNGKNCKWFGEMESPVCGVKGNKNMGRDNRSCPFATDPPPVNEKDKLKCASKTLKGCGKCTHTVLSNEENCKWFGEMDEPVCAVLANEGMGEAHDMCAFPDDKDKRICADKSSSGCESCTNTPIGNGKFCLWSGDIQNPVCSTEVEMGVGNGHNQCTSDGTECSKISDCTNTQWCAPTEVEDVLTCKEYTANGEKCEGYTRPQDYTQCNPATHYCYKPESCFVPDLPGTCELKDSHLSQLGDCCSVDEDCESKMCGSAEIYDGYVINACVDDKAREKLESSVRLRKRIHYASI
mmetsp:Transcript_11433/g.13942  ORF Transcript_11433/g.13942 Transcript_11433/m.13942 type:complete len:439 (-) Transcript_11433:99-1415(-)